MKKNLLILMGLVLVLGLVGVSQAQEPYRRPPKDVVDILDAPPTPLAMVDPRGELMLQVEYDPMPSIEHLARPMLRLAGVRITPQTNGRQQTTYYTGLVIQPLTDGSARRVKLPDGAQLGSVEWSPDGARIAFTRETERGIELWVADGRSGAARPLTSLQLNTTLGSGFEWMPDSRQILCRLVPSDRGPAPEPPRVPKGPIIQETSGKVSKVRTFQDLLENPYDEALFDYYMTAQLALIDVATGQSRMIGKPGLYASVWPSPSGDFLLIDRIERPYSYAVPYTYFPRSVEVWDREGRIVHTVADLQMADEVPIQGVPTGPRSVRWRPLLPATLSWVEALDGGDPKAKVPHRDRVMTLAAPFEAEPREVYKLAERYSGASWLKTGRHALMTEYDRDRRWRTTRLVDVDDPNAQARVIFDLSIHDRYNDPGAPVMTATERGERIILQDGDWIYLSGSGATPDGDRPLLQRMNLQTLAREEIFRSAPTSYEAFLHFVGDSRTRILTRYESSTEPPNYFVRDVRSGQRRALTDFKDPAPQLTGMKKQLVKYTREDSVPLSGTLYLPPDYREGQRLPLVIWAYPLEYSDPSTAGQVRSAPNRFARLSGPSQLFFVTQGYAVLDGAQMPVIGDPDTVNDTFIKQIVMSAEAAIKKLDEMGIADPNRVGVGGHSYGAFMTANLLAHSDLFRAGIARSGAYNRTLTPFGFQSEPRALWEAPDLYVKVSPFMHANTINEPILLIHGEADNNSGTFPIQSERLFHALKGHGATARLVMLPHESHGYRARESVLHVLVEMFEWFDRYVKNAEAYSKKN